jgi:hypothetical protein
MGVMAISSELLWGAANLVSAFVNLSVLVLFIVVTMTVVRRWRPDAVSLILGAVIFELLLTCASLLLSSVMSQLIARSGVAGFRETQAMSGVIFALGHAAARLLLLWGIARLARPVSPTV